MIHAGGDADLLIVKTAVQVALKSDTILVGDDTDLLGDCSSRRCGCKRIGLECTAACSECRGVCTNRDVIDEDGIGT